MAIVILLLSSMSCTVVPGPGGLPMVMMQPVQLGVMPNMRGGPPRVIMVNTMPQRMPVAMPMMMPQPVSYPMPVYRYYGQPGYGGYSGCGNYNYPFYNPRPAPTLGAPWQYPWRPSIRPAGYCPTNAYGGYGRWF